MKLNEKILYCRKRVGLSQLDLADLLGVSRQSVSKWETGEANPEVSKIAPMAKAFGVSTDWLLSDEDPQEPAEPSAAPVQEAAYPEWVANLPKHMGRMVKKYGWLYGVRMAIGGLVFTGIGALARAMFRNMIFGFSSGNPGMYDPFASFNQSAWSTVSLFTGAVIGLGIVITIAGIILAVALKKWGEKN